MPKNEIKKLLIWFGVWRVGLFLVSALAAYFLPYQPSFPYADQLLNYGFPDWFYSWANFDGVHYLTIINQGYFGTGLIQAFFPLFPQLTKLINFLVQNSLFTGLIVSNFFAFALFVSFYQVAKLIAPKQTWTTLLVLLTFPTSFFLGAFYTESLFMTLVLQSFVATQKKHWWQAAVLAGLASATRIVGIFTIVAVVLTFLTDQTTIWQISGQTIKQVWQKIRKHWLLIVCLTLVGSSGLLAYMTYLYFTYQDALYFFHVQAEFGSGRTEGIVLYPQVLWRYLKILLTVRPFDFKYFAYIQEAIAGTVGLWLIFLSSRKINLGWLIFCLGAFFVPTLTGTFSSLPRYLMVIWPLYFVISEKISRQNWRWLYFAIGVALLILNTMLFIRGYWVA